MTKETAAQKHTRKHGERRTARLDNRPLPKFEPSTFTGATAMSGPVIVADVHGELFRIDGVAGTVERMKWAR